MACDYAIRELFVFPLFLPVSAIASDLNQAPDARQSR
jgi:hypothetical protein